MQLSFLEYVHHVLAISIGLTHLFAKEDAALVQILRRCQNLRFRKQRPCKAFPQGKLRSGTGERMKATVAASE